MVARGAKRPRSELRGSCRGSSRCFSRGAGQQELKTLIKAEWRGGLPLVGGSALALRLLSERAAAEAAAARGSASAPVRELRVRARRSRGVTRCRRRCCAASRPTLLAELGYALPLVRRQPIRGDRRSIRRHAVPLRLRSRTASGSARARCAAAASAWRNAAGAAASRYVDAETAGRSEVDSCAMCSTTIRAARRREPPRRPGPAGARLETRRGEPKP